MSGEFDSGKFHIQQNWSEGLEYSKKRNFREFWDSNLSRLHPFDNMAIIH